MFYNKLFQLQLDLCKAVTNVKTLYKQNMTDRAKKTANGYWFTSDFGCIICSIVSKSEVKKSL